MHGVSFEKNKKRICSPGDEKARAHNAMQEQRSGVGKLKFICSSHLTDYSYEERKEMGLGR